MCSLSSRPTRYEHAIMITPTQQRRLRRQHRQKIQQQRSSTTPTGPSGTSSRRKGGRVGGGKVRVQERLGRALRKPERGITLFLDQEAVRHLYLSEVFQHAQRTIREILRQANVAFELRLVTAPAVRIPVQYTSSAPFPQVVLRPLKLVYFGSHGLLVVLFAPPHPEKDPVLLHKLTHRPNNQINRERLQNELVVPLKNWAASHHITTPPPILAAPEDHMETRGGPLTAKRAMETLECCMEEVTEMYAMEHAFVMYSCLGTVSSCNSTHSSTSKTTDNNISSAQTFVEDYLLKWKVAMGGDFPIPTLCKPTSTAEYEMVCLRMQQRCPSLDHEVLEWPINGDTHTIRCGISATTSTFLAQRRRAR